MWDVVGIMINRLLKPFRTLLLWSLPICGANTAIAQNISLTTADGGLEIKGRLLHFDGVDYRIQTEFGALTVSGENMVCTGWECPKQIQLLEQFAFVGGGALVTDLMPQLIQDFATNTNRMAMGNPQSDTRLTMHIQTMDLDPQALVGLSDTPTSVDATNPIYLGDAPKGSLDDFRASILARGALVPVVHPENPIQELTITQLTKILDGSLKNWSDLGGPDMPITMYAPRDLIDHTYQIPKSLSASTLDLATPLPDDADVETMVQRRRDAIGLIRFRRVTNSVIPTIITQCNWEFRPNRFNIQSAEYPLSFAYKMYLPRKRLSKVQRQFLNWLKSENAHNTMAQQGFVGVWPDTQIISEQGDRLRHAIEGLNNAGSTTQLKKMLALLGDGQRLSTTFRYNETGDRLNATSLAYANMVSQAIRDGKFADKTLFFVGFTDNRQGNSAAVSAGLKRAKQVIEQVFDTPYVEDLDESIARPVSFGRVAPVACNGSPEERAMNWRVELWVKDR